jgi:hypothetical protein
MKCQRCGNQLEGEQAVLRCGNCGTISHDEFAKELLGDPGVRAEYERLTPEYDELHSYSHWGLH